jgi:TPR repeat protein
MITSNIDVNKMNPEEIYNEGLRIMESMSRIVDKSELALAQKHYNLALQLFHEASRQNYLPAHIQLANYYDIQVKDKKTAFEHYIKASILGDPQSRYIVSIFLNRGWGVEENKKSAFLIMADLAKEGYDYAQLDLALYYLNGEGCEKNPKLAFEYFSKSAKQGNASAQNDLALCYLNGEGTKPNPFSAIYWFDKAFKNGNYAGLYNIGTMFYSGILIEEDKNKSIDFFLVGAKHNDSSCIDILQRMKIDTTNSPNDISLNIGFIPK